MNTPAHVAASLLVWRKEPGWGNAAALAVGAFLPDAPMFGFYAYQKIIGSSERDIWSQFYYEESWRLFFDIFNSIPLMIAVVAICYALRFRFGVLLGASALLHLGCDFLVHNDDAHRHLLPFTNWRFESPISYWDPKHFGHIFVWLELLFGVGACSFLVWKGKETPIRIFAGVTLFLYAAGIVFVLVVWIPNL